MVELHRAEIEHRQNRFLFVLNFTLNSNSHGISLDLVLWFLLKGEPCNRMDKPQLRSRRMCRWAPCLLLGTANVTALMTSCSSPVPACMPSQLLVLPEKQIRQELSRQSREASWYNSSSLVVPQVRESLARCSWPKWTPVWMRKKWQF